MTRRRLWLLVLAVLLVWPLGVGVAQYRHAVARSQEAMLKNQLYRMRDAIDVHRREQGAHPPSLNALVEKGYLRRVPEDPFTDSTTTWRVVHADGVPGVADVKSGAAGPATDGSRLADW